MKTIICGSRTITAPWFLEHAIAGAGWKITEVVCGGAKGADALGKEWAEKAGIACTMFLADWTAHGKAAGPIRNQQMADYAEACIALHDGISKGTLDMLRRAKKKNLRIHLLNLEGIQGSESKVPPHPENGFNANRFRPLDADQTYDEIEELEPEKLERAAWMRQHMAWLCGWEDEL